MNFSPYLQDKTPNKKLHLITFLFSVIENNWLLKFSRIVKCKTCLECLELVGLVGGSVVSGFNKPLLPPPPTKKKKKSQFKSVKAN